MRRVARVLSVSLSELIYGRRVDFKLIVLELGGGDMRIGGIARRGIGGATAVLMALLCFAVPADAKRARFGFGGIGGSGGASVERVYTLPRSPDLQMPDGRPIDIGRIVGGTKNGTLVGYVGSSREYLNLPKEAMDELVGHAGFADVGALEKHLTDKRQAAAAERKVATDAAVARKMQMRQTAAEAPQVSRATGQGTGGSTWMSLLSTLLAVLTPFLMIGYVMQRVYRWVRPAQEKVSVAAPEVVQRLEGGRRLSARRSSAEPAASAQIPAKETSAARPARVARGLQGATPVFGQR